MKYILITTVLFFTGFAQLRAQQPKIDSIAFHLYTDSLKKGGVYNYINVDAKLASGQWLPLSDKEIKFSSTGGRFEGCNLIFDSTFTADSVVVTAVLKENSEKRQVITIFMKKMPDPDVLKTVEEIMKPQSSQGRKRRRN
ncbi:hypothetical protein HHL16_16605 [Pseudoflavitalea sp. G-6-1-2]|uniref:hypothetical protein n=1 Tax=Pseudoflavitalea sp. G-6-1-2 TaxID=2728841 RepID=UPI00146B2CCC|nr:hypothetical protein [Pseudoflavitalea sp. G-6-1-2]NML22506.1 hypothetical protein [Pseudoflavitalea sp. G-6-1-2]